jgi:hypothetical protein
MKPNRWGTKKTRVRVRYLGVDDALEIAERIEV